MRSEIAIRIAAPPDLVFALARDVERWADVLPHYARSAAIERRPDGSLVVDFIAQRRLVRVLGLGLPVTWRSRTWSEPTARRLRFVHVAGATKGMDVTWRIEPTADGNGHANDGGRGGRADRAGGCTVTIAHHFAPPVPGFAAFVDRFFTRPIAGRTLATFKSIAEAVESVASGASPSDRPT